jgi:hypothetical protein
MTKTKQKLPYTVEHNSRNVATVYLSGYAGTEWWFLLRSDVHHDNPKCDQRLEKKHLQMAADRNAGIIDGGDQFCAMQGKYDKRASKSALRPEHQTDKYLDALVKTSAEFYEPFAHNFIVMGRGNHETAITKVHETDLTERLVERLNTSTGSAIQAGGYGGWVRFMFELRKGFRTSRRLHYFHGTGGGGPVTRGVIQTNRLAVFNPDADIVLTGHTHDEWIVPIARQRMSDMGKLYHDAQIHVRTPGYKDAWGDGDSGWEVEKMLGPKPTGAAWLHFTATSEGIETEVVAAK